MPASTPPLWISFDDLPRAHGGPVVTGRMRERPEDFQVDEIPICEPDGEGEHLLLHVRKTGANTEWVARRLASHAGLPVSKVGYAGLKDKYAVTSQWFTLYAGVHLDPDWSTLDADGVEILEVHRHGRKLRRGGLRGNRFRIRIRDLKGDIGLLDERLDRLRRLGIPNYFGLQRFGNREGNLYAVSALFAGEVKRAPRHARGLWLSAARSQLFNEVLALRVERRDWDSPLDGERMQLDGSRASFLAEAIDEELIERCRAFDIHPSGPLWGAGEILSSGEVAALEQRVLEAFPLWTAGLAAAGLRQERRQLRLHMTAMDAEVTDDLLEIGFALPAGAYATAALRELVAWRQS